MTRNQIPPKQPFPWKKLSLFSFIALVLTLVAVWLIIEISGNRAFEKATEEAYSLGVPESWESYRENIEIPDDKNLAKHPIMQGPEISNTFGSWLVLVRYSTAKKKGTVLDPRLAYQERSPKPTFEEALKLMVVERNKYSKEVRQLSEALNRPHLDFGSVDELGAAESEAHFKLLEIARLVAGDLMIEARISDGNPDLSTAIDLMRHCMNLTKPPNPPTVVNGLIGIFSLDIISSSLAVIPSESLEDKDLKKIQDLLEEINPQEAVISYLKAEGVFLIHVCSSEGDDNLFNLPKYIPRGLEKKWASRIMALNNMKINLLKQSSSLGHKELLNIQALKLEKASGFLGMIQNRVDALASLSEEQIPKFVNIPAGLQTVVVIRRFELANKKWPNKLNDLVPQYLTEVPIDITKGKPFEYSLNSEGLPKLTFQLHDRSQIWEMISDEERDRRFLAN